MTFARTTIVSDAPGEDSVKQGCLDLDTDLTLCYTHLNTLATQLTDKILVSRKGSAGGVCELDADALVPLKRLPVVPSSSLPAGGSCPTGTVTWWPSTTIPAGFVECDGRWLSKTDYADLYAIIAGIYGVNSTKFKVPDLRGYFVRGWSHGSGHDPDVADRTTRGDGTTGDNVGTVQESAVGSHTHNLLTFGSRAPSGTSLEFLCPGSDEHSIISDSGGKESRPINVGMLHIIKT
jgi:microcystin-dependent protein